MHMELIPKTLVVGLFAVEEPGPAPLVTEEKINRIWSEVSPRQGYRQLNLAPDGSGAEFSGRTGEDGVTIQLPLLQVRSGIRMMAAEAAEEAAATLKTIAKHLGLAQFYNLGIKHVYHAAIPTNDARGFVLQRLLDKDEQEVGNLERGGQFWAGLKYGAQAPDGSFYVLVVEPLLADEKFVFLDLDAQFPGVVTLDMIRDHAREAQDYLNGPVKEYLERADTGR